MKTDGSSNTDVRMILMDHGEIILTQFQKTGMPLVYNFITPAVISVERGAHEHGPLGFMLTSWMPFELLTSTTIEVSGLKIVALMNASPEIASFYRSWAEIECDKIHTFAGNFKTQIAAIEKYQLEKYVAAKHHTTKHIPTHKKEVFVDSKHLPDLLIQMFEEDNGWGDPSVTQ